MNANEHLADDVRPREVVGWAMYDFANSGYTTVVITAIYNAWFVSGIAGKAAWATFAWTAALSISYAAILVSAPFIGAWADAHAAKKRVLAVTTAGCIAFTAALSLAGPGDVALAMLFIALSNFFFGTGENIIAAFLPELARGKALGKVSGWGWSLGYLGGIVSLGAALAWVNQARSLGHTGAQFVPTIMIITAGLFLLASLPTFLFLRERGTPQVMHGRARAYDRSPPGATYARVLDTLRHAARYRDLRRFLLCIVFYQAGIQTVIALAAIYAEQALGFSTGDTIVLILVVNLTAALGAFAFGYVQDRIGHVAAIAWTLVGWIVMTLIAWQSETRASFWLAANIAGICLGSSQSAGRALVAWLSPSDRHAEFFGLWGLAVKLSSILGPLTYGTVTWVSAGNHRLAMLVTGAFFLVGLALLFGVDAQRGRAAAEK